MSSGKQFGRKNVMICQLFPAVDLGALKKSFLGDMDEDSRSSVHSSVAPAPAAVAPTVVHAPGFQPTPMQESFQPSSTPTYLQHRYMVNGFFNFGNSCL